MTETYSELDLSKPKVDLKGPSEWLKNSVEDAMSLSGNELTDFHLKWMQERFNTLRSKIVALDSLARKQGVEKIETLEDGAKVLFTHKVYKSYPMNLIEKNKFNLLTQWLDKLTAIDLSDLNTKGIKSIDKWFEKLDQHGMFIFHSTGTTGKLSVIPRSKIERPLLTEAFYKSMEAGTGDPELKDARMPVFFPAYRSGRHYGARILSLIGPELAGCDEDYVTLFDYPMSADFMSLAGRLRAAQARGDLSKMDMIKAVVKSKGELIKMKKKMPQMTQDFFNKAVNDYKDRRVFIMATTTDLLKVAIAGHEKGIRNVFASDSVLLTGGGLKGFKAPDNWKEVMKEFYGVERLYVMYGMTESLSVIPVCKEGHYHPFPWVVPFVLSEDGTLLPREGVQTGRMAFMDLLAETYWGGLITGDKVTVHYDKCSCGWNSPWIEDNITRYSEAQGGDDKISCSGSQDAYNQFLDFVLEDMAE